jgi:hypothetical protein
VPESVTCFLSLPQGRRAERPGAGAADGHCQQPAHLQGVQRGLQLLLGLKRQLQSHRTCSSVRLAPRHDSISMPQCMLHVVMGRPLSRFLFMKVILCRRCRCRTGSSTGSVTSATARPPRSCPPPWTPSCARTSSASRRSGALPPGVTGVGACQPWAYVHAAVIMSLKWRHCKWLQQNMRMQPVSAASQSGGAVISGALASAAHTDASDRLEKIALLQTWCCPPWLSNLCMPVLTALSWACVAGTIAACGTTGACA